MRTFSGFIQSFARVFPYTLGCFGAVLVYAAPEPLFDGKTFNGWEGDTNRVWRIENEEIVGGRPDERQPVNDFLCTKREFENFELRLKYKRGGNNGGVQFRSQRVPNSPEVCGYQADFSPGIDGFLYDESRRRRHLAQPSPETIAMFNVRPWEWTNYRIRVEGPRIRLWVNEVLSVDFTETEPAIPRKGIIALQLHAKATEIRYKDLVIEELPSLPDDSSKGTSEGAR
ncbi:MAG: DUF1080 domain-containing protein [Verrucomicrobiota bacterium]